MENTLKELEVITHSSFLINSAEVFKDESCRVHLKDLIFNQRTLFRDLKGSIINNGDVLRIVTFLSQQVEQLPKEELIEEPFEFVPLKNQSNSPLFLIELKDEIVSKFANKYGYHFWNSDSFIDKFEHSMLKTNRNTGKRKISVSKEAGFNYKKLIEYQQPANYFILNDQYLASLSEKELEINLFPLIDNLTNISAKTEKVNLTIITKIKKDYKIRGQERDIFDQNYWIINVSVLNRLIDLKLSSNIDYDFIILKEYLCFDKKDKGYKLRQKLHKLHDRFFASNYLIGEATNSFSFVKVDGSLLNCDLTISTTIDIVNRTEFEANIEVYNEVIKYAESEEYSSYFLKFGRKRE